MRLPFLLLLLLLSYSAIAQRPKKERTIKSAFEKGVLRDSQPVGVWEYYDSKGRLELSMNYDSSRIVYSRPDTARYLLRVSDQWQLVQPARAPRYMGSQHKRLQTIGQALRYPISAIQRGQEGTVLMSYAVDEQGHTGSYQVEEAVSKEFAEAVWQALKKVPDQWIPAVYLGRPRAARFYLQVHFLLEDHPLPVVATTPPYVSQLEVRATTRVEIR